MALIQTEGRVEDAISWLFDGGEESKKQVAANLQSGSNLKIDITDELAKITDLELTFKCTKQEVERVVVACEGDLEKTEENMKAQKQESEAMSLQTKPEESADPNSLNKKVVMPVPNPSAQVKGVTAAQTKVGGAAVLATATQQHKRDERDFNYTKSPVNVVAVPQELANKNSQAMRRAQLKSDWARQQQAAAAAAAAAAPMEKRWLGPTSTPSSASSSPLPVPVTQAKMAIHEMKTNNAQIGTVREPVIVMQRPQSTNTRQSHQSSGLGISASPPPTSGGWHSNGLLGLDMKMPSMMIPNGGLGHGLPNPSLNVLANAHQYVPQSHFKTSQISSSSSSSSSLALPRHWGCSPDGAMAGPCLRRRPSIGAPAG
uniref:UBA domain-containing protein n=1 Tax=Ananas comosus var. bracteatus TaxID=296719 RepID=A0A6V7QAP2_ANACO|nr:unnamed protein product [Ananas comosus var. bracteatus]